MNSTTAPDRALADAENFATTVRQAAARLFGRTAVASALDTIVERLLDDCHRLRDRGAAIAYARS